jgi:putative nucleotidyltransferase with HDIG domain
VVTPNGVRKPGWLARLAASPSRPIATAAIAASLVLAALLTPELFGLGPVGLTGSIPRVGEIADRSYKAPADIEILDEEATEDLRRAAIEQASVVYDFDERKASALRERMREAFTAGRRSLHGQEEDSDATPEETFLDALGDEPSEFPKRSVTLLVERGLAPEDESALLKLVGGVSSHMILDDKTELDRQAEKRVVMVRELGSGTERRLLSEDRVLSLDDARAQVREAGGSIFQKVPRAQRKLLVSLAETFVLANLNFNLRATDERRQAAADGVKAVATSLRKGEIVVRDGVPFTEHHIRILRGISAQERAERRLGTFFGVAAVVLSLLVVLWRFGSSSLARFPRQPKDALFLLTVLVSTALGLRFGLFLCDAVAERLADVPFVPESPEAYYYVIPVAVATMLVRLVHSAETAVLFAVLVSLLSALEVGGRVEYAVFALAGSLIAARGVARVTQRGTVLRAGLRVGLAQFVVVGALSLLSGSPPLVPTAISMTLGFVGGALAGVFVSGLAPLVETVFSYTTDIKLLELANREQPLLRELELRAPGTYHHSMMVGHIAERAGESIGANALLARVAAYYHDIGKMRRPHFFIENMTIHGGENRHEKISPSMSARIIQAHVRDGLEYGRDESLASPIMDGIAQHHGTSIVRFFYEKAREQADPEKGVVVEEHDYRYPGPKPQTREAGILMLADSVEAAARTLSDNSPARVQQLVQRIINNYFRDGQLDDCNLTLRDLHRIARSFIDTLSAIHHERIDYPAPAEEERKPQEVVNEGVVERLEPRTKDRSERSSEEGEGDIRRLGLP